jgi:hypothetical protein
MDNRQKLFWVKLLHTGIWAGFNAILFYLLLALWTNQVDKWVWMAVGAVLLEGLVLLAFHQQCPLTLVARRYTDLRHDNFDIFLPLWLARHNKLIYTSFFVLLLLFLAYRLISG